MAIPIPLKWASYEVCHGHRGKIAVKFEILSIKKL
jgi:hypothetical protein